LLTVGISYTVMAVNTHLLPEHVKECDSLLHVTIGNKKSCHDYCDSSDTTDSSESINWNVLEELDLARMTNKLISEDSFGTLDYVNFCIGEYKKFLRMIVIYPELTLVPPKDVDKVWHRHILDTFAYQDFCEKFCGYFLHHVPDYEPSPLRDPQFTKTVEIFLDTFGSIINNSEITLLEKNWCTKMWAPEISVKSERTQQHYKKPHAGPHCGSGCGGGGGCGSGCGGGGGCGNAKKYYLNGKYYTSREAYNNAFKEYRKQKAEKAEMKSKAKKQKKEQKEQDKKEKKEREKNEKKAMKENEMGKKENGTGSI